MLDINNIVRWHNSRKGARKITAADVQVQAFSLPYWRMNGKAKVHFRYEIGAYSAQAEAAAMQCYQAELAEHAALLSDIRYKIKQNDKAIERGENGVATSFQKGYLDAQERRARVDRPEKPSPESFIEWNWSRPLVTTNRIEMTLPSFAAAQLVAGLPDNIHGWLQRHALETALDTPAIALPEDETLVSDSPALKEAGIAAIRSAIVAQRDAHVRSYEVLDADFVDDGEAFRRHIWVATVRSGRLRSMLLVGRDYEIYGQALAKPISTSHLVMAAIALVLFAGFAFQRIRESVDSPVSPEQFAAAQRHVKPPQAVRPAREQGVVSSKDAPPAGAASTPFIAANVIAPGEAAPTAQQQTVAQDQDADAAVGALLKLSEAMDWASVDQQAAAMKSTWVAQPRGNRKLARAANEQGIVQLKLGDFSAAGISFQQGLTADPSDIEVRNNLAFALLHDRQFSKAVNVLTQVLRQAPDRSSAWANLAQSLPDPNLADAALRLAVRFSANRAKTFAYLQDTALNSDDAQFKAVAAKVLIELGAIPRGPDDRGTVTGLPLSAVQAAVTSP